MNINYKKVEKELQSKYKLFKIKVLPKNENLFEILVIDENKTLDFMVMWFECFDYDDNIHNIIQKINESVGEEYV